MTPGERLVSIPSPRAVLVIAFRRAHPSGVYVCGSHPEMGRDRECTRSCGTKRQRCWNRVGSWALSHISLLLVSERRADKGILNDQKFFSSSTDPMNTPFVLPRGDRSGNSRATASAFYLWVFLKLASFFFFFLLPLSERSALSFLPGDDDDPYLEMGLLGRSLEGRQIMCSLLYRR